MTWGSSIIAAAAILAVGTGLGSARLTAQEAPAELTGCYDITVGDWVVEKTVPGRDEPEPLPSESPDSIYYEIPPRIQFVSGGAGRTVIVVPEGAMPSVHRYRRSAIVGDSLRLSFSTAFTGVTARLVRSGAGWTGTARGFTDVVPYQVNARPITLLPVPCDTPPPVSVDETMPPLARSVELESGLVITLGEPLPEQLETEAAPPRTVERSGSLDTIPSNWLLVVGRTRGLFGTTDSVAVLLNRSSEVGEIRLRYPGADSFERLDARLRDLYGPPQDWPFPATVFVNRVTDLFLYTGESDGAYIELHTRRR